LCRDGQKGLGFFRKAFRRPVNDSAALDTVSIDEKRGKLGKDEDISHRESCSSGMVQHDAGQCSAPEATRTQRSIEQASTADCESYSAALDSYRSWHAGDRIPEHEAEDECALWPKSGCILLY
jgi:hypothetical protein